MNKVCSKCKRDLPETLEYFFKRHNGKNGLMAYCKECFGKKFMKKITHGDSHKKCPSCKKSLPYTHDYFAKTPRTKSGLSATCKKCVAENGKNHYDRNKAEIDAKHREYYRDNKETVSQRIKRYRKENPEKVKVIWQKRRAKLSNLPNTFSGEEWVFCKNYFDNKCAYCGKRENLTQDHFVPLNLGGEYTNQNILPVCLSCNSSKGAKLFSDWYPKQIFYSKHREKRILKYLSYEKNTQQIAFL